MIYIDRSLTTVAIGGFTRPFPNSLPNELFVIQFEVFSASLFWMLGVADITGIMLLSTLAVTPGIPYSLDLKELPVIITKVIWPLMP